jgi:hypothetical protein
MEVGAFGRVPLQTPTRDRTTAPQPTRWVGVDAPAFGQADEPEEPSVSNRAAEHAIVQSVKGSTSIAVDLTSRMVLDAVDGASAAARASDAPVVRVGIIGFFDARLLNRQIRERDLPAIPRARRVCFVADGRCPFGSPGARSANTIAATTYAVNPDIELYLVEAATLPAMKRAVDWLSTNDVDVMVPLALVPWDDSGNGKGPAGRLLQSAVRKGIHVVTAAGDAGVDYSYQYYNGRYWRGTAKDADGDSWLEFAPGDESLGAYCGSLYGLRWDDWSGRATDYDLYISDATRTPDGLVDGSNRRLVGGRNQARPGTQPIEANDLRWLCNRDPRRGPVYDVNGDNFVSLWVRRTSRSSEPWRGDVIEIMLLNGWLEYATTKRSVQDPWAVASSPGVLTVGAVIDSDVPWFTPSGPTNDGRQKPNFVSNGCYQFTPRANCSDEGDDEDVDRDVFRSTAVAAGFAAAKVSQLVADFEPQDANDIAWLTQTYVRRLAGQSSPDPRLGYGDLTPIQVPRVGASLVKMPYFGGGKMKSPPGTSGDLDRIFSKAGTVLTDSGLYSSSPLTPTLVTVSVTGARRAGSVQIWGRGQSPSQGASAHFERSRGRQTRTIAVRDAFGLWARASTGGDIVIQLGGNLYVPEPGYAVVEPTLNLRSATQGSAPAGRPLTTARPGTLPLHDGEPVYAVTVVSPSRAGELRRPRGDPFRFEAGRSTTFYDIGESWRSLVPSVPVTVDVDVLAVQERAEGARWRGVDNEVRVALQPNVPRVVDLGPLNGGSNAVVDVLVQGVAKSDTAGSVSTIDPTGRVRRMLDHGAGVTAAGTVIRARGGTVTLRSTSAVTVTLHVLGQSLMPASLVPLVEPPRQMAGSVVTSDDGSVVVAQSSHLVPSEGVQVWDRTTNVVRNLDVSAETGPDGLFLVAGISGDGATLAYTVNGSPAALVLHDLVTDERTRHPLPGAFTSAPNLKATSDLTRFVVRQYADSRTLHLSGGTLRLVTYPAWSVSDISADGTRLVARSTSTSRLSLIDVDGRVIRSIERAPASNLTSDGRTWVTSDGEIVTDGVVRSKICAKDSQASIRYAHVDRTGSHIVVSASCWQSGLEGIYVLDGGTLTRLASQTQIAPLISPDGSSVFLVFGNRLAGVHTHPVR